MLNIMEFLWRRRPCIFPSLLILWIAAFIRISESCSRRSMPKVRSPMVVQLPPTLPAPQEQTGNFSVTHFECPSTYQKWYCLNGAACFTLKIGDAILYNCRCPEGYMGQRCEYKDTDDSYAQVRARHIVKTASIAGGVTLGVIILIVTSVATTIYIRRRRARKNAAQSPMSPEQLLRSPFGRVLPKTEQFKVGRTWSHQPGPAVSTLQRTNEQEILLQRLSQPVRNPPRASTSDVSLSDDADAINNVITSLPVQMEITRNESPHPYSMKGSSLRDLPT